MFHKLVGFDSWFWRESDYTGYGPLGNGVTPKSWGCWPLSAECVCSEKRDTHGFYHPLTR